MNASSVAKHNYINLKVLIQTNQDQQWKRINGKISWKREFSSWQLEHSLLLNTKKCIFRSFLLFPTQTPN